MGGGLQNGDSSTWSDLIAIEVVILAHKDCTFQAAALKGVVTKFQRFAKLWSLRPLSLLVSLDVITRHELGSGTSNEYVNASAGTLSAGGCNVTIQGLINSCPLLESMTYRYRVDICDHKQNQQVSKW